MNKSITEECKKAAAAFLSLETIAPEIEAACDICINAIRTGRTIYICGNGGSAADAQHFAAELVGRYRKERKALKAVALTVDTSILTSIGNDYGFDDIFARQISGLAQTGDVLIAISTSGNSQNILRAINAARSSGVKTIGLTGIGGGQMSEMCDVLVAAPSADVPHIQELHAAICHIVCGVIEESVCA